MEQQEQKVEQQFEEPVQQDSAVEAPEAAPQPSVEPAASSSLPAAPPPAETIRSRFEDELAAAEALLKSDDFVDERSKAALQAMAGVVRKMATDAAASERIISSVYQSQTERQAWEQWSEQNPSVPINEGRKIWNEVVQGVMREYPQADRAYAQGIADERFKAAIAARAGGAPAAPKTQPFRPVTPGGARAVPSQAARQAAPAENLSVEEKARRGYYGNLENLLT